MLKIRLSRIGKKHQPLFRVVVCDSKNKQSGKVVETIGNYNPLVEGKNIVIKKDRYQYWVSKGAQPSQSVLHLVK